MWPGLVLLILCLASPLWAEEAPAVWYQQAQVLYEEGDLEGALALLGEIPKRFPQAKEYHLKAALLAARIHFERKEYDQTLALLKPFLKETKLPAEGLYLLAAASERKGLFSEALTYLRLLKMRHEESAFHCEADLIAARIFKKRRLTEKATRFAKRVLEGGCPLEEQAEALSLLLDFGLSPENLSRFFKEETLRHAPEILKTLALFYIKKGDLKRAEENIYKYLNYSGREKEAPVLLFRLGEAYYQRKEFREARRLFELINTSWPYAKEASLAKFRLLYMRYLFEKKIAFPRPQTMKLLITTARGLKREWPESPITEEAHALEIALLLELKRIPEALESGWDFLKRYPRSSYRQEVLKVVCRASSLWLQGLLARKKYQEAILFFKDHEEALSEGQCGLSFFRATEAYLALNLHGEALLTLLKGYGYQLPPNWAPDYYLTLVDLLLFYGEKGDLALAKRILAQVEGLYPLSTKSPYWAFLKGALALREGRKDQALSLLKEALEKAADPTLTERAKDLYLSLLLDLGRYQEAFELAKKDPSPGLLKDLASRCLEEERWPLAQEVISYLEEKFPQDSEVKWLRGLYYERQGEAEKALLVWKSLSKEKDLYGELARNLVEAARLLEETRSELY